MESTSGHGESALGSIPDLQTRDAIRCYLRGVAETIGAAEDDDAVASELDKRDPLAHLRSFFHVPSVDQLLNEREGHSSELKPEARYY